MLSWAADLQLVRIDGSDVHLSVRPGQRDLLRFAQQQRERLAELMRSVLKRPVRVEIAAPQHSADAPPPPTSANGDQLSQQEAMSLPLVRQVLEYFDATLVQAKRNKKSGNEETNDVRES